MVAKLLPLFPRHHTYAEAFGGGASMLFAKAPSPVEVYNDLDKTIVNLFRCLQDKEQFQELRHRLLYTLYSCSEFARAIEILNDAECAHPVDLAWAKFVTQNQGFAANAKTESNWGRTFTSVGGMAEVANGWLMRLSMLPEWNRRLARVQIDCIDAIKFIRYWDTQGTLFYLDPPYVLDTRKGGKKYNYEMDNGKHEELITLIQTLKGKVILSGYPHPIYDALDKNGWNKIEFETACHAAGRTRNSVLQGEGSAIKKVPRTEVVWMNFEPNSAVWQSKKQLNLLNL